MKWNKDVEFSYGDKSATLKLEVSDDIQRKHPGLFILHGHVVVGDKKWYCGKTCDTMEKGIATLQEQAKVLLDKMATEDFKETLHDQSIWRQGYSLV